MTLWVVMYHYVRDLPRTPWPAIKGLLVDDFRHQVFELRDRYEMATLESAVAFLRGRYQPRRPLCLLTFDDGLNDHYCEVLPILRDAGVQGVFLVQTSGPLGRVAAVHKNHFLLAALGLDQYRERFLDRLARQDIDTSFEIDDHAVRRFYRWDPIDVARFKYLANFLVAEDVRQRVLDELFADYFGDEAAFARSLYLTWDEARDMQSAGMVIGGHSHAHAVLTHLTDEEKRTDLTQCAALLREHLRPQELWPFSYPYGDADASTIDILHELQFACGFTTAVGSNDPYSDLFRIRRIDPKDVGELRAAV